MAKKKDTTITERRPAVSAPQGCGCGCHGGIAFGPAWGGGWCHCRRVAGASKGWEGAAQAETSSQVRKAVYREEDRLEYCEEIHREGESREEANRQAEGVSRGGVAARGGFDSLLV